MPTSIAKHAPGCSLQVRQTDPAGVGLGLVSAPRHMSADNIPEPESSTARPPTSPARVVVEGSTTKPAGERAEFPTPAFVRRSTRLRLGETSALPPPLRHLG